MATEKQLIDRNEIFPNGTFFANAENPLKSLDELIARIWRINVVDAVEVVRCKECKYAACNPVNLTYACRHPSGLRGFVNEGFYFCSHGEREIE